MFCYKCGKKLVENASFCSNCGEDVTVKTPTGAIPAGIQPPDAFTPQPQYAPQPVNMYGPTESDAVYQPAAKNPNKKKLLIIGLIIAAVLGVYFLFFYSGNLVGTWEAVSGSEVYRGGYESWEFMRGEMILVFNSNGTGTSIEYNRPENFRWQTEGRTLRIFSEYGDYMNFNYSISGSSLTLKMEDYDEVVTIILRKVR